MRNCDFTVNFLVRGIAFIVVLPWKSDPAPN